MNDVQRATLATEIADIVLDADSKFERDALAAEIYDWLADGDDVDGLTAEALAVEWEIYEADAAEATQEF